MSERESVCVCVGGQSEIKSTFGLRVHIKEVVYIRGFVLKLDTSVPFKSVSYTRENS